jgi:hypothetical protein
LEVYVPISLIHSAVGRAHQRANTAAINNDNKSQHGQATKEYVDDIFSFLCTDYMFVSSAISLEVKMNKYCHVFVCLIIVEGLLQCIQCLAAQLILLVSAVQFEL